MFGGADLPKWTSNDTGDLRPAGLAIRIITDLDLTYLQSEGSA